MMRSQSLTAEILANHTADVFVETGTGLGGGVLLALNSGFQTAYSIELSQVNLRRACGSLRGFLESGRAHVFGGDSRFVLRSILPLFAGQNIVAFLDSHGPECPLLYEIETLAAHVGGLQLLVDDVRLMQTHRWGFDLADVEAAIAEHLPKLTLAAKYDTRGGVENLWAYV